MASSVVKTAANNLDFHFKLAFSMATIAASICLLYWQKRSIIFAEAVLEMGEERFSRLLFRVFTDQSVIGVCR